MAATVTGTTWTATLPAGTLPAGERTVGITAMATDAVGNTATLSGEVEIDTVVRNFSRTGGEIGGDGVLSAAEVEVAQDLTLTGIVEPNSTVQVRLSNGATQSVSVGASGRWSVSFDAADLPAGERDMQATITATDRAGNRATITETFAVGTVAPETSTVESFASDARCLRRIGTGVTDDTYAFLRINEDGSSVGLTALRTDDTEFGEMSFTFGSGAVPDGSYLVINTGDAAGNTTSTLLVVDNTSAADVDLSRAGLQQFDFNAIDLTFAPDAGLTITAAQLQGLTGPDRELIVNGDSDDTVTARGAVDTGDTVQIDGQTYAVYALGSHGARLILDDDTQLNAWAGWSGRWP